MHHNRAFRSADRALVLPFASVRISDTRFNVVVGAFRVSDNHLTQQVGVFRNAYRLKKYWEVFSASSFMLIDKIWRTELLVLHNILRNYMEGNRNKNIFDKIGEILPGYNGYAEREERRNIDRKIRDTIYDTLNSTQNILSGLLKECIEINEMLEAKRIDSLIKDLNTFSTKIKYMEYGASSFFSEKQIKSEQLCRIYEFDLLLMERVNTIRTDAEHLVGEPLRINSIKKSLDDIDKKILQRSSYIKQFK